MFFEISSQERFACMTSCCSWFETEVDHEDRTWDAMKHCLQLRQIPSESIIYSLFWICFFLYSIETRFPRSGHVLPLCSWTKLGPYIIWDLDPLLYWSLVLIRPHPTVLSQIWLVIKISRPKTSFGPEFDLSSQELVLLALFYLHMPIFEVILEWNFIRGLCPVMTWSAGLTYNYLL